MDRSVAAAGPILVVDDDDVLLDFICLALTEQGYRTARASDGMNALKLSAELQPSLVLMDVGMPGLSGCDLADRIHELTGGCIPCVVMSGGVLSEGQRAADAVAGYLAKPFDLDELFRLVQELAGVPQPTSAG